MVSLFDEILSGRNEQFRALIREYNDDLLRMGFQYFQDWDEAQETCQKTWIKVYKSLKSYQQNKPFNQWLLKIHTNVCRTHYRQSFWRKFIRISTGLSEERSRVNDKENISADMEIVMGILGTFTWKQKSIFILCELHGLSSKDAGKIIGISDSTVRVQLARVKRKLKQELMKKMK